MMVGQLYQEHFDESLTYCDAAAVELTAIKEEDAQVYACIGISAAILSIEVGTDIL